jgi:toxin ParE1/3/4
LGWTVERSATVGADIEAIYDHLFAAQLSFGALPARAHTTCAARIDQIETLIGTLALAPFQGVRDDSILPGLRHVTKRRAILYFRPDVERSVVEVLAVFFGGQDHTKRILARKLG